METIPFYNLLYTAIPLIVVWYFYAKWTGDKKDILYSTLRMVLQLLLIGYVLIYIFESKEPTIGMLIIMFMIIVSALITIRNTTKPTKKEYGTIFLALAGSGLIHLYIIIEWVLDLTPFYEPRYVVPIAGMIFANIMNALSLNIERFSKEVMHETFEKARSIAFKSAMIPQINSLLAVGLVALPGMMTGQILSGVDPLIAVRYQIMIMMMILSSAGLSIILYYYLKKADYHE